MTCAGARPGTRLRNAFIECDRLPFDAAVKVAYARIGGKRSCRRRAARLIRNEEAAQPGSYGRALRV